VIVQTTTYRNYTTSTEYLANFYQRDTFMAENVEWIEEHDAGPHPKLMIWAHDIHTANNQFYGTPDRRNLGGELRARYHESYLSIGTSLYQGTFRTYTDYPKNSIQTIYPAQPTTSNYTLGQVGLPLYMLDLRNLPSGPVYNWAHSFSTFLLYNTGGQDASTPAQLNQWFDVIIHIQNTTPSQYFYASPPSR
jgi:erythromycin esterase-like protein